MPVVADDLIAVDDPRSPDARELLERHLAFAHRHTRPEDVHALDISGLLLPSITFYGYRRDGALLAIGAIKRLNAEQAEIKSMHTAEESRGHGIGAALVAHLVEEARQMGFRRLSLETGSGPAFAPARSLYLRAGFAPCPPFDQYDDNPNSVYMTRALIGD
jgi:putative acetyltransferase